MPDTAGLQGQPRGPVRAEAARQKVSPSDQGRTAGHAVESFHDFCRERGDRVAQWQFSVYDEQRCSHEREHRGMTAGAALAILYSSSFSPAAFVKRRGKDATLGRCLSCRCTTSFCFLGMAASADCFMQPCPSDPSRHRRSGSLEDMFFVVQVGLVKAEVQNWSPHVHYLCALLVRLQSGFILFIIKVSLRRLGPKLTLP